MRPEAAALYKRGLERFARATTRAPSPIGSGVRDRSAARVPVRRGAGETARRRLQGRGGAVPAFPGDPPEPRPGERDADGAGTLRAAPGRPPEVVVVSSRASRRRLPRRRPSGGATRSGWVHRRGRRRRRRRHRLHRGVVRGAPRRRARAVVRSVRSALATAESRCRSRRRARARRCADRHRRRAFRGGAPAGARARPADRRLVGPGRLQVGARFDRRRRGGAAAGVLALLLPFASACMGPGDFRCTEHVQCVGVTPGTCEATAAAVSRQGLPPSRRRYAHHAGGAPIPASGDGAAQPHRRRSAAGADMPAWCARRQPLAGDATIAARSATARARRARSPFASRPSKRSRGRGRDRTPARSPPAPPCSAGAPTTRPARRRRRPVAACPLSPGVQG